METIWSSLTNVVFVFDNPDGRQTFSSCLWRHCQSDMSHVADDVIFEQLEKMFDEMDDAGEQPAGPVLRLTNRNADKDDGTRGGRVSSQKVRLANSKQIRKYVSFCVCVFSL